MNTSSTDREKIPPLSVTADKSLLYAHVKFLTEIRPYRNFYNTESLNAAAEYIIKEFRKYSRDAAYQSFPVQGREYKNVICSIGPEKGARIIVGAHYDVCGDQPGADDNASAVAGLIEILRIVSSAESRLRHRIDFAAYTLEEPPNFRSINMGSCVHASYLKKKEVKVKGMICLEMIGYFTDKENSQSFPAAPMNLLYPATGNFIAIVSNISSSSFAGAVEAGMRMPGIDVQKLIAPSLLPGVDFSDHLNFWNLKYNAVMITDTAFYRNPNYHMETDTIDTLDFEKMALVASGVARSIIEMK